MGWSGVLFAAIVLGWAAYLIPHALRRYDQATRSRSIDRFSSAMRVLGAKPTSDTVASVKPSSAEARPVLSDQEKQAQRRVQLMAARAAARRRRQVLKVLLLGTLVTAAVAGVGVIPWWSFIAPAALVLAFLFACSRQVRRESEGYWANAADEEANAQAVAVTVSRPAARVESAYVSAPSTNVRPKVKRVAKPVPAAATQSSAQATARGSTGDEPTVEIDRRDLAQIAVPVETSDGGLLWDPVPV
ncbi:MAG: hypothetical protein GEU96_21225, partial [Propionibacteriales bacterium]|nr:hypothetical protein [Propionibacteriales bacterium]